MASIPAMLGGTEVGDLKFTARTAASPGWLMCYGQAVSRTTYSDLFSAISTTYGSGDGSTTFNVPDMRGRMPVGKDDMGGSSASRVTSVSSGVDATVVGAVGGAQTHTLTSAQMPSHNHSVTDPGHSHTLSAAAGAGGNVGAGGSGYGYPTSGTTASVSTGISVGNAGSGSAHNNMPPCIVFNAMIYTGV